ncbi:two pore domain potassium channel family protein [Roseiconus nitratireducens]|uniref:Two pore domain potassium channel family protein n=1 Tax=Roseiconus nitratireducens TaxID=2605748 RepID=A0A5M6DDG9_9BACT|nr:ion channel [Roseiconus nitratireducens]KAA5545443.1 two pore domain potassium channel family protein [Roseiconus nitratireducens]
MIGNLLLSFLIMGCCISVQSFFAAVMLKAFFMFDDRGLINSSVFRNAMILSTVTLIMLVGIVLQMLIWATTFVAVGEFNDLRHAFYHSAVNFTSLGYGDVVMSEERRLLGALEAANGVLMFGLTTSLLFALMAILIKRRWSAELSRHL